MALHYCGRYHPVMDFADRVVDAQRQKRTPLILGVDPQLDRPGAPGIPRDTSLARFCCEIIEACAEFVVAVKPQLAFFEARGRDGMDAFAEVLAFAKTRGLITIADAKRGDIGSTSAAYAEAFLGKGDFACDAVTVNPYLGSDALAPFVARMRTGRGLFVLVKTSNPSSGEFQDLAVGGRPAWEAIAERVNGWGSDYIGRSGLSSVGAVVGATYPAQAARARALMPSAIVLAPGFGAQGASAPDAVAAARSDGLGVIVSSSRALMYAPLSATVRSQAAAAARAAVSMRDELNDALARRSRC
ncbi:MAG TPA: orotidine-5'-phosphate decarboxylase [Candidatus Binataceae bacterium]|nr:orotidine-5'-phosphate decarboxylase [Candidatus Binataceae bacterium]